MRMIERLSFFCSHKLLHSFQSLFVLWQPAMNNIPADAAKMYSIHLSQHAPKLNCLMESKVNELVWRNNYFITDL